MIIASILSALTIFIFFIFSLLPSISISAIDGFDTFIELMVIANAFVPINTFMAVLGIWLLLNSTDIIWQSINWVIKKIPGIN